MLLEEGVCYDQGVLLAKLLAFALLHSIYQGQICLLLQVFLYFLLLHSSPLCIFSVTGWGIGLDHHDIEWFVMEMNRDLSVIFEIASKYYISDSLVDSDGYSISSNGFLPTVVDIVVI